MIRPTGATVRAASGGIADGPRFGDELAGRVGPFRCDPMGAEDALISGGFPLAGRCSVSNFVRALPFTPITL